MPYVSIDFYTPIGPDGSYIDIRAALLAATLLPSEKRLLDTGDRDKFFLEKVTALDDDSVIGSAAAIRMHGIPGKFKGSDFTLSDLDLADVDGVAEEVSFLVSHKLQTVALQRNGAFRSSRVEMFLNQLTGMAFVFDPKVRADKFARLKGVEEYSEVSFKLTNPLLDTDFKDTIPGVGETIKDAAKIGTLATVELTLRLRTGEENPQDVSTISKLLTQLAERGDTSKLFAKARRPSQNIEAVDLIKDRIVAGDDVDYGNGRRLNGDQCRLLLRKAIDTNQLFLESLLMKKPS